MLGVRCVYALYVNRAKDPSLAVEELSDRKDGGISLCVGPGRGGHFANLTIAQAT